MKDGHELSTLSICTHTDPTSRALRFGGDRASSVEQVATPANFSEGAAEAPPAAMFQDASLRAQTHELARLPASSACEIGFVLPLTGLDIGASAYLIEVSRQKFNFEIMTKCRKSCTCARERPSGT